MAEYVLIATPRASKTRQLGSAPPPVRIAGVLHSDRSIIAVVRGHPLDPVAAWLAHSTLNQFDQPAMQVQPAFTFRQSDQVAVPLRRSDLVRAAKAMAELQGVNPDSVAGHRFRRGVASYAFRAGVPDVLIQRQGDWQSMEYRKYLTLPAAKALGATRAMFHLMSQPAAEGGYGASALQAGLEPMDNTGRGRGALG
eukprot:jgi/Ulvmu1/7344/UM036_0004.1